MMPARHRFLLWTLRVLICLAVVTAAGPSPAEQDAAAKLYEAGMRVPPMQFFVASGADDACGKDCNRWIAAEGRITPDTVAGLERLLDRMGSEKLPIFFHSPGGLGYQGMALGRLLRQRGLTVGVGATVPAHCAWPILDLCL